MEFCYGQISTETATYSLIMGRYVYSLIMGRYVYILRVKFYACFKECCHSTILCNSKVTTVTVE